MSKKFFRWQDFSVKFLNAVLQSSKTPAKYHPPVEYDEAAFVAPYLGNLCKFPDEHFVSKYRKEIEEYFLSEPEHLENVAKTLEHQNYAGIRSKDEDALCKLKQCKLSQAVIMAYLDEMIRTGSEGEFQLKTSFYKPRTILLGDSHIQDVKLYYYQQEGYAAMKADTQAFVAAEEQNGKLLLQKYFDGFGVMPTPQELEDIAELTATEKAFPEFQSFDERDDIDPSKLAMKYREETSLANIFKIQQDIHAIYNAHKMIIDSLYGNVESYQRRIFDFLLYPTGVTPMGSSIEEAETEFGLLSAEPFAEPLEILLDEVLAEQKDNLGDDFKRPTIGWTKKAYKTYFAQYVYLGDNIKMNCGLNSASVPREVLKYLIYHECLHQLIHSHGPKFRELERRFPNFNELDNYLDYQFPTFVKEESR